MAVTERFHNIVCFGTGESICPYKGPEWNWLESCLPVAIQYRTGYSLYVSQLRPWWYVNSILVLYRNSEIDPVQIPLEYHSGPFTTLPPRDFHPNMLVAKVKKPSSTWRKVHEPIVLCKYTNQNQFSISKKSKHQKVTRKKCYLPGFQSSPTSPGITFLSFSNGNNYKLCFVRVYSCWFMCLSW